ncbi:BspA family leucine-rich repeat surface protein [Brachyspira sp.]
MFFNACSFNADISICNTSNVKDMNCMFSYTEVFNCDI